MHNNTSFVFVFLPFLICGINPHKFVFCNCTTMYWFSCCGSIVVFQCFKPVISYKFHHSWHWHEIGDPRSQSSGRVRRPHPGSWRILSVSIHASLPSSLPPSPPPPSTPPCSLPHLSVSCSFLAPSSLSSLSAFHVLILCFRVAWCMFLGHVWKCCFQNVAFNMLNFILWPS